jgi:hypothetical protein
MTTTDTGKFGGVALPSRSTLSRRRSRDMLVSSNPLSCDGPYPSRCCCSSAFRRSRRCLRLGAPPSLDFRLVAGCMANIIAWCPSNRWRRFSTETALRLCPPSALSFPSRLAQLLTRPFPSVRRRTCSPKSCRTLRSPGRRKRGHGLHLKARGTSAGLLPFVSHDSSFGFFNEAPTSRTEVVRYRSLYRTNMSIVSRFECSSAA